MSARATQRPPHPAKHILVVDDEYLCRELTRMSVEAMGYAAESVCSAEEALGRFDPAKCDLVITDCKMPGMSGLELAAELKHRSPSIPILMCTGTAPSDAEGIDVVLEKPVVLAVLKENVRRLLKAQD